MPRRKLKVSILIEVVLDADEQTRLHFEATGEITDAVKYSIERAETRVQEVLDKNAKKLEAVVSADYGSIDVR
jgi:ATP-dependent Zn protease